MLLQVTLLLAAARPVAAVLVALVLDVGEQAQGTASASSVITSSQVSATVHHARSSATNSAWSASPSTG